MGIWPQFRSPLIWDVFAVSTYGTVSLLFWYVGPRPRPGDVARSRQEQVHIKRALRRAGARLARLGAALAALRDRLPAARRPVDAAGALGPHRRELRLRGRLVPGWHATIFPPYFVAGAIYAGFAMVLTLAIPLRKCYGLEDFITMRHIENMAKVMLVTGLIVFYGYVMEAFFGWYSANQYEKFMINNRMTGPYAWSYWMLIFCNGLMPQMLWFKKLRTNTDLALHHVAHRQRRHVARALRHHRHVAAPRLPAVVVGHVLPDDLGLHHLLRHDRPVHDAVVPLRPRAADDLDLRGADAAAGSEGQVEHDHVTISTRTERMIMSAHATGNTDSTA